MAVHPNRMIAATGQGHGYYKREGDPHIQVWNTVSLQRLHILGRGDYRRAIIALSFSKRDGGRWLVGVDEAPDVTLSVWDWSKGVKQIETKCSSEMVICVEFHPLDESVIVTCGKGVLDPRDKPKFFTCIAFSNTGDVLTGDSNGNIFVWGRGYNAVTKAIWNAHAGPVFSICVLKDGHILTGGGKDGKIVKYTPELRLSGEEANLPPYLGSVRVIAQGVGNQILVGTTRNSILAGNMELNFATIVSGHCDEVWSLAARPGSSQYITAGHDRYIYLWDSLSCSPVWSNDIGEQVQGADFSPDGELLALTTVTGKWLLLDARTREIRTVSQEGCDPLLGVKFAPSGKSLAILARSALFLYQLGPEYQNFTRLGRFSTQAGVYGTIVWSKDSKFVQVTSTDRELQAWRICRPDEDEEVTSPDSLCGKKGPPRTPENHLSRPGSRLDITNTLSAKLETAIPDQVKRIQDMDELRDVDWTSTDCLLSWNCLGVWQEEGWEITVGSRAEDDSILVVGEENGSIRTYRYPACQPICKFNRVSAHSGPVTALRFLDELSRVITIGGRDTAVMQWTIES